MPEKEYTLEQYVKIVTKEHVDFEEQVRALLDSVIEDFSVAQALVSVCSDTTLDTLQDDLIRLLFSEEEKIYARLKRIDRDISIARAHQGDGTDVYVSLTETLEAERNQLRVELQELQK